MQGLFQFIDQYFNPGQYITLLVTSDYDSGRAITLEPDKCELWQWFDYRKFPEPLFEPITAFLSQSVLARQADLYSQHCASRKTIVE